MNRHGLLATGILLPKWLEDFRKVFEYKNGEGSLSCCCNFEKGVQWGR